MLLLGEGVCGQNKTSYQLRSMGASSLTWAEKIALQFSVRGASFLFCAQSSVRQCSPMLGAGEVSGRYTNISDVEPVVHQIWSLASSSLPSSERNTAAKLCKADLTDDTTIDVLDTVARLLNNWTGHKVDVPASPAPGTPATPLNASTVVASCVEEIQQLWKTVPPGTESGVDADNESNGSQNSVSDSD